MRQHCELFLPRKDGSVMIDHCLSYENTKGEWPKEFPMPDIPEAGFEIWEMYWELRRATPAGLNGAQPIAFSEIAAWKQLYEKQVSTSEIYYIRLLDEQYMQTYIELNKTTKQIRTTSK